MEAWEAVLRLTERAVTSKMMKNWCDARDIDEDCEGRAGDAVEEPDRDWDHDADNDGCVIRKIAHMLL